MRTAKFLEALLACAEEEIDPPVCRAFWHPGPDAPHDVCETGAGGVDGQLWVALLTTNQGWPSPDGEPTSCASAWTDNIEIGIVRCARGKLGDDGAIPPADDVTADAQQQIEDRDALRRAILCCLDVENKDIIVEGWEAVAPLGGCVGGTWTLRSRHAGCDCTPES